MQDLHETLVKCFRWKVGERRVQEGRYSIARACDGVVVNAKNWEEVMQSGEPLVMSMLILRVRVENMEKTCPRCGKTRLGTYEDQGWLVW